METVRALSPSGQSTLAAAMTPPPLPLARLPLPHIQSDKRKVFQRGSGSYLKCKKSPVLGGILISLTGLYFSPCLFCDRDIVRGAVRWVQSLPRFTP